MTGAAGEPVGPVDASAVPRFAGLRTFARLPRIEDVEAARIAVLGAPFDGGTTFRSGQRFGPASIREASLLLRQYDPVLDTCPFGAAQVADAGDVALNPVEIGSAHGSIEAAAEGLHSSGTAVVGLGGDHSVSLPLLRAAASAHGPLALIQLDAHTDTWDSYFGTGLTHGTMFRRALEEGVIDGGRSVQIGLRGSLYSSTDMEENRELGFSTFTAEQIYRHGVEPALEMVADVVDGAAYLTVDVDVMDPAFAPGTGTPEIGGISSRELLHLLQGIDRHLGARLAAADVVEVSPGHDSGGVTALAAANTAYRLIGMLGRRAASGS